MRIGARIGNYVLEKELARGGFGVVFVARHAQMGQRIAVKFLHRQWSDDHEQVQRFFNDARAATLADDPGIVRVMDAGFFEGYAFLLMEFLAGEALAARLARAPVSPLVAVTLMRQAARALSKVHAVGIVHRDLKPDNLFLVPDPEVPGGERVKILDFGIAKLADVSLANKTATRAVFGTPAYMSPEQCRSAASVDPRSDIYSLGCILFEMSCGRPPFEGETGELIGKHQNVAPPAPRSLNPAVSPEVEAILLRSLAKDPAARQQSMAELVRDLDGVAQKLSLPVTPPKADIAPVLTPPSTWSPPSDRATQIAPTPPIVTAHADLAPRRARSTTPTRTWIIGGAGLVVLGAGSWILVAMSRQAAPPPIESSVKADVDGGVSMSASTPTSDGGAPGTASAEIWSTPAGAQLEIDGSSTGTTTPLKLGELESGRKYKVVLKKECYQDEVRELVPSSTKPTKLTVALKPVDRQVRVDTVPSGVETFAGDGRSLGKTPFQIFVSADLDPAQPPTFTFRRAGGPDVVMTLSPDLPCKMMNGMGMMAVTQRL